LFHDAAKASRFPVKFPLASVEIDGAGTASPV
jgi:hypothetical protein